MGTFLLTFPVPETINKIKMNLVACIKSIMTKKKQVHVIKKDVFLSCHERGKKKKILSPHQNLPSLLFYLGTCNVLHSRSKQLDVKILIIIKKDQVTTIPCLTTTSLPGSNLSTVTSILSSSEMFQGVVID